MSAPSRVILLACGSFNPITNMHLRMFELARDALHQSNACRVIGGIISPVGDSYDKKGLIPAKHRCAMIRLALKSSDWIRLDTWECERETWSPTQHVLKHHKDHIDSSFNANLDAPTKRRKIDSNLSVDSDYSSSSHHNNHNLNEMSPIQIKLLCGADLLDSFAVPDLWKPEHMEDIVKSFGLVVISRAGSNPEKFVYESDVLSKYKNNITIVTEWIHNEISATKIRRALQRGESVKYLVQDSVIDFIKAHKLYGAGENKLANYTTPSPNRDSPDFDKMNQANMMPNSAYLSPYSTRNNLSNDVHCNNNDYLDNRSVESKHPFHAHGFRRHRDLNYDEEQRKCAARRSESLDRKLVIRSTTFDKNSDFNKRVSSSFDSLDSPPRTPKPPPSLYNVSSSSSSHTDMAGLSRRLHGMRIVSITPETSV